jgi:membrane protease YdiL (CAAX protease family)
MCCVTCPQVLAQFLYTSIFGWYAAWLFVRSGHLAAPVAVHAACNALGFPDFERMNRCRSCADPGCLTLVRDSFGCQLV